MSGPEESHSDFLSLREIPTRMPQPSDLPLGESTGDFGGRYEIQSKIGGGGMGAVYRATDRELNRVVAIKRIRPELLAHPEARVRFEQEARAIATLNHPNIVQIYDRGVDSHGPFLIMEFIAGASLADRLAGGRPLELDEAIRVTLALCDALQAAHDRNILHRDVKPANVLFAADGTPKLTDFGLARLETTHEVTQAGAILGTPFYMSPEQQVDATRATPQSDQWSLAATLYHMLTGEPPRRLLERRLPELIREIVLRATEERPESRFPSMQHFKGALEFAWTKPSSNRFVDENVSSDALDTLKRQIAMVRQKHELARRLAYEQHDWGQAKNTLDSLPEDVRDAALYEDVARKAEMVFGLTESIARATRQLQWIGLNLAVEELAKLQPQRPDLAEMSALIDPKYVVKPSDLGQSTATGLIEKIVAIHPSLEQSEGIRSARRDFSRQSELLEYAREREEFLRLYAIKKVKNELTLLDLDTVAALLRATPDGDAFRPKLVKVYDELIKFVFAELDPLRKSFNLKSSRKAYTEICTPRLRKLMPGVPLDEVLPTGDATDNLGWWVRGIILLPCGVGLICLLIAWQGSSVIRNRRESLMRRCPIAFKGAIDETTEAIRWWL